MNKPNVGDILVGRYSYNSIIYTFYQAVKVTKSTVTLAQIEKRGCGNYNGGEYLVWPNPNRRIIGESFVKRLPNGRGYIKHGYEYIRPWDGSAMVEAHGMD